MTLLQLIQEVCPLLAITSPNAVTGSADPQVLQLWKIANEEGRKLSARYPWQSLQNESSFLTVATESQGAITTLAGAGFRYIINETIWNRSLMRPVFGPLTPSQFEQLKAQTMNGPWNQYIFRGGNVLFTPVPTAGQSCYFMWVTKYWALSNASVAQGGFLADDDTTVLDNDIFLQGLIWRWNKRKGFDYAEDFAEYERLVADAMARDGGKPTLNLDGYRNTLSPGIIVPTGSWNV